MASGSSINDLVQIRLNAGQTNLADSLVLITQQVVARVQEERADKRVLINDDLQWVEAHREKSKLVSFKARISDNVSALTKASNALDWVESNLNEMKTLLQGLSDSSTTEERAAAAEEFDELYEDINSRVNNAHQRIGYQNVNLIGNTHGPNWTTDNLYTPSSMSGGYLSVEGQYAGAEFVIEDADGDYWRIEETKNGFVEYDSSGAATGNVVSLDGLTLDSYDSSTGAVTYSGSDSLSGTLQRGGIELLSSEYYSDFADQTSIDEAIDDIDSALTAISQKGAIIKGQASLIEGNFDLLAEKIAHLDGEIQNRVAVTTQENAELQRATNVKIGLIVNNLNLTTAANTGLIENMLALTEGVPSAGGIFGLMGY